MTTDRPGDYKAQAAAQASKPAPSASAPDGHTPLEALTVIADWDKVDLRYEHQPELLDVIKSITECARRALSTGPASAAGECLTSAGAQQGAAAIPFMNIHSLTTGGSNPTTGRPPGGGEASAKPMASPAPTTPAAGEWQTGALHTARGALLFIANAKAEISDGLAAYAGQVADDVGKQMLASSPAPGERRQWPSEDDVLSACQVYDRAALGGAEHPEAIRAVLNAAAPVEGQAPQREHAEILERENARLKAELHKDNERIKLLEAGQAPQGIRALLEEATVRFNVSSISIHHDWLKRAMAALSAPVRDAREI